MKELMVHVERIVRPIHAASTRKLKMRQEFLAHLTGIFEEEKTRLGDERQALDQALRRFGNPADLTRDLQASVPVFERVFMTPVPGMGWERHLAKSVAKKPGESTIRHAVRVATIVAVFVSFWLLLAETLDAVGQIRGSYGIGLSAAVLVGYFFLSSLWVYGIWRAFAERLNAASILWAGACSLAGITTGLGLLAGGYVTQPNNPLWSLILHNPGDMDALVAIAFFTGIPLIAVPLLLVLITRIEKTSRQRYEEWTSLQID